MLCLLKLILARPTSAFQLVLLKDRSAMCSAHSCFSAKQTDTCPMRRAMLQGSLKQVEHVMCAYLAHAAGIGDEEVCLSSQIWSLCRCLPDGVDIKVLVAEEHLQA